MAFGPGRDSGSPVGSVVMPFGLVTQARSSGPGSPAAPFGAGRRFREQVNTRRTIGGGLAARYGISMAANVASEFGEQSAGGSSGCGVGSWLALRRPSVRTSQEVSSGPAGCRTGDRVSVSRPALSGRRLGLRKNCSPHRGGVLMKLLGLSTQVRSDVVRPLACRTMTGRWRRRSVAGRGGATMNLTPKQLRILQLIRGLPHPSALFADDAELADEIGVSKRSPCSNTSRRSSRKEGEASPATPTKLALWPLLTGSPCPDEARPYPLPAGGEDRNKVIRSRSSKIAMSSTCLTSSVPAPGVSAHVRPPCRATDATRGILEGDYILVERTTPPGTATAWWRSSPTAKRRSRPSTARPTASACSPRTPSSSRSTSRRPQGAKGSCAWCCGSTDHRAPVNPDRSHRDEREAGTAFGHVLGIMAGYAVVSTRSSFPTPPLLLN